MNTTSCFGTLSPQKFHRLSCLDVNEVMNTAVELCRITEPTDEIADLSDSIAFRFQYFVYCKVSVAIDVDLLNFEAIKLVFAIQVFQRIRRRICWYARLDLEQFVLPSVSITFVERPVARLGDADRVFDVEMPSHSCFL